jgi:hypothetical protein
MKKSSTTRKVPERRTASGSQRGAAALAGAVVEVWRVVMAPFSSLRQGESQQPDLVR